MEIPREAIDELKAIYKKEFDKNTSDSEAQEMAMRLLRLFQLLRYSPKPGLTDSNRVDSMNRKS